MSVTPGTTLVLSKLDRVQSSRLRTGCKKRTFGADSVNFSIPSPLRRNSWVTPAHSFQMKHRTSSFIARSP